MGDARQIDIVDPRVGGTFCIVERRAGGGATHRHGLLGLERPRRWRSPGARRRSADQSRVHIEIRAVEDGCELALTHEMEPRWAPHVDRIERGWVHALDAMATMSSTAPIR